MPRNVDFSEGGKLGVPGEKPSKHRKDQQGGINMKFHTGLGFSGDSAEINISRHYSPTVIGTCCCGDPALVAKLNKIK